VNWIVALVAVAVGGFIGWAVTLLLVRRFELGGINQQRLKAEAEAAKIVEDAKAAAENTKRGAELAGKEEVLRAKESLDEELAKRRGEIERMERRLVDRESMLDRKYSLLDRRPSQRKAPATTSSWRISIGDSSAWPACRQTTRSASSCG
jgi:ribonuclease Y